jgi:PRTRC genetic system protein B
MKTHVEIGSSQDYRLRRALLVYGESNYNGFPYRHPFLTLHEVTHEGDEARLGAGQLVTPRLLLDLLESLQGSAPLEILPERVLARTPETIVWWSAAQQQRMFFSDRGGDAALKKMNGRVYPHPPLLFKASASHLWIRALSGNERPKADAKLFIAPYWNCSDEGAVCTGSMKIPRDKSVTQIDRWEQSFFKSEFTHAGGLTKKTRYRGGLLAMWQSLEGANEYPESYLVPAKQTLAEFVRGRAEGQPHAERHR